VRQSHARAAGPREVYSVVVDPECSLPTAPLVAEVRDRLHAVAGAPAALPELRARAEDWCRSETERFLLLRKEIDSEGTREAVVRRAALGCAPLSLASGAWLQWLSSPSTSEDDTRLRVLSLYAGDVGAGHPRAARGSAYLTMLRHLLLSEYAAPVVRLPADERIADYAFTLPAVLLLMSRKPGDFAPEIMGADLCLRTVGTLPAVAMLREELGPVVDWAAMDPAAARQADAPSSLDHCLDAVQPFLVSSHDRVTLGFAWALAELTAWSESLHRELRLAFDPAFEMAELVRLRSREASIYHHNFRLDGQPLTDAFKQARHDPAPMMRALAASRLVRPGRADLSPLVTGLVAERGPMFRVFSPGDLRVLRRWIDALPAAAAAPAPPTPVEPTLSLSTLHDPVETGRAPQSVREAYHMLQTRADTVELRRYAQEYAHKWLEQSRLVDVQLPEHWDAGGLRSWLLDQHDRHSAEYEAADEPIPSRDELIDYTVQLSPMTLIDGAWLTGFTDYSLASTEIGFSLFATYWDELGNSELSLNHPVIYRELLAEMDAVPPPTGSAEFAHWPRFADSSFDLPVYWLCVSRFPQTFLPELLGLNLAIELSGVGGTYRRAQQAQRAHRFSTRFTDIHSTIDNVSTGHSAWAVDAIDTYLASISTSDGPEARALLWERVRTGYAALTAGDLGL
jgi:hypothetical protein